MFKAACKECRRLFQDRASYSRIKNSIDLFGRGIKTTSAAAMPIKVGDKLPSAVLYENDPNTKLNTQDLFGKGKHVLFGVPGAFTPGCSKTHLPGFVENSDSIKAKGVSSISCISVNDPFVMEAWGRAHGVEGKVRMLADTCAQFTKAIDLELDLSEVLGNVRSKRYSLVVTDGVVTSVNVEPDGKGLTCSLAPNLVKQL
ncbi:hypothetical protein ScPMuIL_013886 [Solemya velum]